MLLLNHGSTTLAVHPSLDLCKHTRDIMQLVGAIAEKLNINRYSWGETKLLILCHRQRCGHSPHSKFFICRII